MAKQCLTLELLRYLDTFVKTDGGLALGRAPAPRGLARGTQLVMTATSRLGFVSILAAPGDDE
jgi:hypothetical protein